MSFVHKDGVLVYTEGKYLGQTPNANLKRRMIPEVIVIHYTAGGFPKDDSDDFMMRLSAKVAAHFFVDYDGTVSQLSDPRIPTYHAGESSWRGRKYVNNFSVGIEIANPGILTKKDGVYITHGGTTIPEDRVVTGPRPDNGDDAYWCAYDQRQIKSLHTLIAALRAQFGNIPLTGHSDIAPTRKIDPGPAFPFSEFAIDNDDDRPAYKTTARVNLRTAPNTASTVILTIPDDATVFLEEDDDGWIRVSYTSDRAYNGWVSTRYVTPVM